MEATCMLTFIFLRYPQARRRLRLRVRGRAEGVREDHDESREGQGSGQGGPGGGVKIGIERGGGEKDADSASLHRLDRVAWTLWRTCGCR